jgi:hypothetical protein
MLPYRSHWHFAFERDPFGEARLVRFAGPDSTYVPPEPTPDPLEGTPYGPKEGAFDPTLAPMPRMKDRVRSQVQDVLHDDARILPKTPEELKAAEEEKKKKEPEKEQQQNDEEKRRETMRQKMNNVVQALRDEMSKMRGLRGRMQNKELMGRMEKYANANLLERWKRDIETLEREELNTTRELQFAEAFQNFWQGEMAPEEFLEEQGDYMRNLPYGFDELGTQIHKTASSIAPVQKEGDNASDAIQRMQTMRDNIQADSWIASQGSIRKRIDRLLTEKEKWIKEIEEQSDSILAEENVDDTGGFTKALLSLRFYSINNYVHGVQKYWAALKKTLEDRNERYDADIARSLGRAMRHFDFWPLYGEAVDSILEQQLESKGDEEKDAKKKQLERQGARWADLFNHGDPKGVFWHLAESNPNEARGVLEYAADHGFLYEIDEVTGNPDMPIYGIPLSRICRDWFDAGEYQKISNYFSTLRAKNSAGRESEISNSEKTVHDIDDVDKFINLLGAEMDDLNLWSTVGICKRAIQRGLKGEVSARLLTTIMKKLKQHPELRKVTPKIFFDLIGKESMYNTAFTLGWAKAERPKLRQWAITGKDDIMDGTAFEMIWKIEKEIVEKDPSTDYTTDLGIKTLNQTVAKVLAGQIVTLPSGRYMHIFQNEFTNYRKSAKDTFVAVADPLKEDSDYAIEDTEKTMLPQVVFNKILAYTSTFEFKDESWVQGFFGNIISIARRLKAIPELSEAHENYCREIRQKLDAYMGSYMHENRAIKQLSQLAKGPDFESPAIATLISEDLLSIDTLKDKGIRAAAENQIRGSFFEFYDQKIRGNTPGKTTQAI